jgi:hypothetical protein
MCGLTPRTEHPGFGEAQTEGSLCDFEPAAGRRLMPAHKSPSAKSFTTDPRSRPGQ